MQAKTNSTLITPKIDYKDGYTKDMEKWKKVYQPQTKSYAYEPEMPNRPMGKIK